MNEQGEMRAVGDQDAAGLLRRCCAHRKGHHCTSCEPAVSLAFPRLDDPGVLVPRGPLAADVQARVEEIAGWPLRGENTVRLLLDGSVTFGAMLALLRDARKEVRFENFIFRADAVGIAFADELRRRAEEGVDVRVLHDPFGSLMSRRAPIGLRFQRTPVRVRVYNPPRPTPGFLRRGRDHRKLVVQDRTRAVAGGLCLADAWLGNCVERCTWRDSAVLVEGAAAEDAADAFDEMWRAGISFALHRRVDRGAAAGADAKAPRLTGTIPVRLIEDGGGRRRVERILTEVFRSAEREILVTNPYVLPTRELRDALGDAVRRGVSVELLLPLEGNHRVVARASEQGWGALLEAGVRIWRWAGPMIHAKTVVVDRAWTLVGSSNLDRLSLVRNAELNFEIHGSAVGRSMAAVFTHDRRRSSSMSLDEWRERPVRRRVGGWLAARLQRWL